jgi:hypothetical protein
MGYRGSMAPLMFDSYLYLYPEEGGRGWQDILNQNGGDMDHLRPPMNYTHRFASILVIFYHFDSVVDSGPYCMG